MSFDKSDDNYSKQVDTGNYGNLNLSSNFRIERVGFCFEKCVSSFKEKPVSPYEKECMYECLQNQVMVELEIHNNMLKYEELKPRY